MVVCLYSALDGLAACPGCPLPSPNVSWGRLLMGRAGIEPTTLRLQDSPLTPLSYSCTYRAASPEGAPKIGNEKNHHSYNNYNADIISV